MYNVVTLLYDFAKYNRRRIGAGLEKIAISPDQMSTLTDVLSRSKRPPKPVDIGMSIYGLQIFDEDDDLELKKEVLRFVSTVTLMIPRCRESFSAKEIGMAMYGLKGLSSKSPEIGQLLVELTRALADVNLRLDAQAIGNCLYGLQSMHDSLEVNTFLNVLQRKISECDCHLSAQHIGNALYGLQNQYNISAVLNSLGPFVEKCNAKFSAQEISNALYGLKSVSSSESAVQTILRALAVKLEHCDDTFKSQETVMHSSAYRR